jgi:hypothetical protein
MAFFATASGFTMERVLSTAILQISKVSGPEGHGSGSAVHVYRHRESQVTFYFIKLLR